MLALYILFCEQVHLNVFHSAALNKGKFSRAKSLISMQRKVKREQLDAGEVDVLIASIFKGRKRHGRRGQRRALGSLG